MRIMEHLWQYGNGRRKILTIDGYSCISLEAVNNFFFKKNLTKYFKSKCNMRIKVITHFVSFKKNNEIKYLFYFIIKYLNN